ncbi:MAG: PIN domain-containing protein [Pirellulales bacterium]
MTQTFADSFYLLALFNPRDSAHQRAVAASQSLEGVLVTTEWVLTEVADALSNPINRNACVDFINDLRHSPRFKIESSSNALFESGWSLYAARPDKDWSLTDCISFVVMQERGITEALTGDHHFEQAGFRALLK